MNKPNSLVNTNEGSTVSNASPQSPTGRALLDSITLDFDPMSFQFKEDSPLTSPSDSNQDMGELLSPSQNVDVVEFFDPFCPVKEESPTDYYPNVMLGQPPLDDPLIDSLLETQELANMDEPPVYRSSDPMDGFPEMNELPLSDEPLIDNTNEPIHYPDMSNDDEQFYAFQPPCEDDVIVDVQNVNDLLEDLSEDSNEFQSEFYSNAGFADSQSSNPTVVEDVESVKESEDTLYEEVFLPSDSDQMFEDNKHELNSQHDTSQNFEDDKSLKSRTSSASSTHSSKSEKRIYKSSEIKKEEINHTSDVISKEKAFFKKESSKKDTVKREANGYSSHNGLDSTVSLKNNKNSELDEKSLEEKSSISLASVTDLKSSFTKSSEESDLNALPEIKPSVDRVKVQRTFSQSGQDELCLCKICGKHVYQMEKMKAEKNIFHKNCFRCKECNKLLTVDSYSSNDGDIYCKPHFRQLFQPKARFDGEDAAPTENLNDEGKQRRNEMIIRENVPAELPPDVVRSDSKQDHGLGSIPVNLSSIKSKFETFKEDHHLPSTTDVCTLSRSASVMARLAKYQSAVSGADNENGELSESESNDEECSEDPSVIKPSKHKEKVVFSGMSSLKSQWEAGSVTASKEEKAEEKKEELNKLRQRICLGRSESMKAVYEKACHDTSKSSPLRPEPVDVGRDIKATRLKEKFEKGELVNEIEEGNLERFRKEKEEDLSVFDEPGIANDAKKLFKQIDATVKTTTIIPKSPSKSPLHERQTGIHSPVKDADVVKCSEPTEKEEITVDTTDLNQRFKFFENYSESPKERKRFQITPPREPQKEDTPEREVLHDPNVIRAVDTVDDIPTTDTARRMLDKFKALEKDTPSVPSGLKPLKRITPPREYTKVDKSHDSSPEPERDPNIVRSSYKMDDDIIVEADKAKSLRAKFENWDSELKENKRNEEDEEENFLPQVDTTKTLRAKFEAIKEDTLKPIEKPKAKVNRFIQEQAATMTDICNICGKKVYPMEKMETSGMRIHKNCFRCAHCSCMLRLENYTKSGRSLYCTPHFKQLFISRGNYDEGFGREQHKEKWNRSCNNTPDPRELQEGHDDLELSNGDVQCLEQTV